MQGFESALNSCVFSNGSTFLSLPLLIFKMSIGITILVPPQVSGAAKRQYVSKRLGEAVVNDKGVCNSLLSQHTHTHTQSAHTHSTHTHNTHILDLICKLFKECHVML